MYSTEWIEKKIKDYKRFVTTLLILSIYLYIGTLISIFEYQTSVYLYLYPLIAIGLITAFTLTVKMKKWKKRLSAEE